MSRTHWPIVLKARINCLLACCIACITLILLPRGSYYPATSKLYLIWLQFFDHSSLSLGTKVTPYLFVHCQPWVEAPPALPDKPWFHCRRIPRDNGGYSRTRTSLFSCSLLERPIHATPVSRTQGGRGHLSPHRSFYFRTTYITYPPCEELPWCPLGDSNPRHPD